MDRPILRKKRKHEQREEEEEDSSSPPLADAVTAAAVAGADWTAPMPSLSADSNHNADVDATNSIEQPATINDDDDEDVSNNNYYNQEEEDFETDGVNIPSSTEKSTDDGNPLPHPVTI